MTQLLTISANNSAKIPVAIPRTIFNPFLIPESSITCPTSKFSKALLNINKLKDSLEPRSSLYSVTWSNLQRLIPNQLHLTLHPTLATVLDHLDRNFQRISWKDRRLLKFRPALQYRRLKYPLELIQISRVSYSSSVMNYFLLCRRIV